MSHDLSFMSSALNTDSSGIGNSVRYCMFAFHKEARIRKQVWDGVGIKIQIGFHESPESFGEVDTMRWGKYQCLATVGKGGW